MVTALEVIKLNTVQDYPGALMVAWAEHMIPMEVEDGHIFIKEGEEIKNIVLVESGKLVRTKLSVPEEERIGILEQGHEKIQENSIIVDEVLPGTGPTGLLHSFDAGNPAFATVTASGHCKVWLMPSEKFRAVVSKPEYAIACMSALAKRVRMGTKNFRALVEKSVEADTEGNVIKVLSYDSTSWVIENFDRAVAQFNKEHDLQIKITYTTERLSTQSAVYASGHDVVCLFVNDTADADTIKILSKVGVKMISNRCAGFDRIDTKAALAYGISLARVPAYSPYSVAEFAISLLMGINRKIARASARVKMSNFSLDSGLMGCDIHGKVRMDGSATNNDIVVQSQD